jgi:hypothetical protein
MCGADGAANGLYVGCGAQSSRLAEAQLTAADEERREREELGLDLEEERSELPPIPESPAASEADSTELTSLSVRQRMSAESVEAHLRSLLLQVRSTYPNTPTDNYMNRISSAYHRAIG